MARRRWTIDTIKQVVDGKQPFVQFGYTKELNTKRKEGDVWKDSKGRKWKREGRKNIRMDSTDTPIIDEINKSSKCSGCGMNIRIYGNRLDKKVFPKTGKCYDCLEEDEMILRATGKWENYEKMKLLKNKRSILKNFKEKVLEAINFLKNDTGKMCEVMSNGDVVTFSGKSNPQWLIDAEEDLVKVNNELKTINKEIDDFELELKK